MHLKSVRMLILEIVGNLDIGRLEAMSEAKRFVDNIGRLVFDPCMRRWFGIQNEYWEAIIWKCSD